MEIISLILRSFYLDKKNPYNSTYSIEKPKYFKKGWAHGFISYLCSKINELNLINKL